MEGFQNIFIAATLIAAMFMGCTFNSMNIIEEKENGVALVNQILPMKRSQYIVQKFLWAYETAALKKLTGTVPAPLSALYQEANTLEFWYQYFVLEKQNLSLPSCRQYHLTMKSNT
ncbi:MAG: ABC transporter permease, partial [Lachnospiraceae bacterium]|nr:ABC transporter permease [Lachnospiraceae bacterium]